jgi:hypothetical protein
VPAILGRDASSQSGPGGVTRPLYPVSRVHLEAMTTAIGLWQYARGAEPDPRFGYCTDDVARSIVVDVLQSRELGWPAVDAGVRRSLRYLDEAFDRTSARFLNFRSADGEWLETDASEDCHARAIAGLASLIVEIPSTELAEEAWQLFVRALPVAKSFDAVRSMSASLLACDLIVSARTSREIESTFDRLAARLVTVFGDPTADWPWPETALTYENAIVPRALIAAGRRLGQPALLARGCRVLDWLIDVQMGESGVFSPIGNEAWWRRSGPRSRFDQQPIEAGALVAAATDAFRATGERHYPAAAEAAYGWFLGDNDLGVALADPARGSCYDGLTPAGPNTNQGAESTLMWLTALEQIRELRRSTCVGVPPDGPCRPGTQSWSGT